MPRSFVESSLKNVFANDSKVADAAIERNRDMVLRAGNCKDLPNDTLIIYDKAGHIPMEEPPVETA